MIPKKYSDIVTDELLVNSLDHAVHPGFLEDYRVLTALLRIHNPKTIFECGTNVGGGINVMAAALPDAKIFSLDLDYETMKLDSKQYPIGENGEDRVGSAARVPYTQLRGDSMKFDYSQYPCEAAFIDSEHDYEHPYHEAKAMIKNGTNLIIFHDANMGEVERGIVDAFKYNGAYELFRVDGTRIAFALKRNKRSNVIFDEAGQWQ